MEIDNCEIGPGAYLAGVNLEGVDLSRVNLARACLAGAQLANSNLSNVDLREADLSGADLTGVQCYGTSFARAKMTEVNLSRANFWWSDFTGSDLTGANLPGANLNGSDLGAANLSGANLTGADLSGTYLSQAPDSRPVLLHGVNLTGADRTDANLCGARLPRANLSQARLWRTDMHGADLTDAVLSGSSLVEVDLVGATLRRVDLSSAELWFVNFTGADLSGVVLQSTSNESGLDYVPGANLTGADLSGAYFRYGTLSRSNLSQSLLVGADLSEADLDEAILVGSDLSGANLSGSRLTGVDFTGSTLTGVALEGAKVDRATIWPSGFEPPPDVLMAVDGLQAEASPLKSEVKDSALAAGVRRLCHFTRVEFLDAILSEGQILPTRNLLARDPGFVRNDLHRRDQHLGHISLSVQYPNLWVLEEYRRRYPDSAGWAILIVSPRWLWSEGTLFSPVNAAQDNGAHVQGGPNGFESMFQRHPPSRHHRYRGLTHLPSCPTDNQAEVLVPGPIPVADVTHVLVETDWIYGEVLADVLPQAESVQPYLEHNPEFFNRDHLTASI